MNNESTPLCPQPLAIAVAAGTLPLTSFAAAGKVYFAFSEVSAENTAGETRKLKRGHELEPGDTIITERGHAQLRFTDGSFVSLQPRTSFKLEEYNYDNEGDGSERSSFSLFRAACVPSPVLSGGAIAAPTASTPRWRLSVSAVPVTSSSSMTAA